MTQKHGYKMLDDWAIAFERQSPAAMAALYSQHAIFFGSTPSLVRGRAGVFAYFAGIFPLQEARVSFSEVEIFAESDQVHVAGVCRVTFTGGVISTARMTHSLRREGDAWKIVCHHASPATSEYNLPKK